MLPWGARFYLIWLLTGNFLVVKSAIKIIIWIKPINLDATRQNILIMHLSLSSVFQGFSSSIIIWHFVLPPSPLFATACPCFASLPLSFSHSGWWCQCCMWICVIGEQCLIDWVKNKEQRGVRACVWVSAWGWEARNCVDAGTSLRNLGEEPYVKTGYF